MPPLRLVPLLVAALVLSACGGAGGAMPRGGDDAAKADGCPQVEVVGLRGQSQSLDHHRGLGTEVDQVVTRMTELLQDAGVDDVLVEAIRHDSHDASDLGIYEADVRQGERLLTARLKEVSATCPSSRLVVVGFSQGSQIASETLASTPSLAKDVDLLVLIGNPRHDPAAKVTRVDLPGPEPTGHGSLGAGPDLGELARRTVEACVQGDVVCNLPTGGGLDYTAHKHAYEGAKAAQAIAETAVTVLGDES
ncbi:hypothetical protein ASD11_08840 [Aeromicrobium sp. Root495]|uniref:cutinase family protein n=1 Tax=Aeromicrobium sp. Root495 TaxID=1736550 RepID=UPI00070173F6|nr:cutinase family protein [Aeromicrobium sp. Root495]KQY59644.1 hypothetical protein ASD11_08840 [Aeromicrobium sp. Root495]